MFCRKCGNQIEEGNKFCRVCGTPVPVMTPPQNNGMPPQNSGMPPQNNGLPPQNNGKPPKMKAPKPTKQPTEERMPNVKTVPEYQESEGGSGVTKILALIAVICVLLAVIGVLGYFFYPTIKGKIDETSFNGTYRKAQTAYEEERYEDAKGYYIRLLETDPENEDLYLGLAKTYEKLGDVDEAIDTLVDGYDEIDHSKEGAGSAILDLLKDYLEEKGQTLADVGINIDSSDDENVPDEGTENTAGGNEDPSAPSEEAADEVQTYTGERQNVNIEVRQVDNSQFPHMTVYVSVTDQNGQPVENLSTSDFKITEIDKNGVVSDAALEDVYRILGEDRINVNLVLDASSSMSGGKISQAKNAAGSLLDYMSLDTGDRVEIISFDSYVYLQQDFTSRKELLVSAVNGITTDGRTALYDAIYAGVYQTYFENGAKCVIAFTDGEENASSYSFNDVVTLAKNTGIPVYIIGIGDYQYDKSVLMQLASECSGRYYSANDADLQSILEDIYIGIYKEQQDYYVFEYTASNTEDKNEFRDLVIDTSDTTQYNGHYVKSYVPESDINGAFSGSYANKDYILDFSSNRELVESDLANLSLAELRIARNEIFARHGRQFKDPFLNQWFYSKDWYLAIPNKYAPDYFDQQHPDNLSKLETRNVTFIRNYEDQILASRDIFPQASTELLTVYDLVLRKEDLQTALAQMSRYNSTPTLEENKRLVQSAIDSPEVAY